MTPQEKERKNQTDINPADIAEAFQKTIIKDLLKKTERAIQGQKIKALVLTGGVAANSTLREAFAEAAARNNILFYCPASEWCTDNAAMIAAVGARYIKAGRRSSWDLPAVPNLEL